ncbi:eCIS core domain-containing protein [Geodermatophilus aquaeductus]|uniref:eCIS core domain-containing protein n=1 Tax=Geodermatophilus aquaeductus TaxID=1564161 RepID=UPI001C8D3F63|nr:DUF4157 domain-containing protein [Geodermatophilus aquaeductus]
MVEDDEDQAGAGTGVGDVTPVLQAKGDGADRLDATASVPLPVGDGGAALEDPARAFFEARFGHDFGRVRVHAGDEVSRSAASLGAAAFTVGGHIYFGPGRYAPDTDAGRRLLAHELTHVVQQGAAPPARAHAVGDAVVQRPSPAQVQRYSLKGFPPAEETAMKAAVPRAIAKVRSCSGISWWGRRSIPLAINDMRFDYVPQLGLCGWTFPGAWYIEIGKQAFDPATCCELASTIAHEASHTQLYTEGRARRLECTCFGCSC